MAKVNWGGRRNRGEYAREYAMGTDQVADRLALPGWAYVPGVDEAPDRAPLDGVKALVPVRFDGHVPATHPALLYGLRLNNEGLFWEAHEILEAVWKAAPQGGLDRLCLRGCIQIANANLKLKMGRPRAVDRLLADAAAEFAELAVRRRGSGTGSFAAGYPVAAMVAQLRTRAASAGPGGTIILIGATVTCPGT